jgi:CO/xanthine dehydrogenase Mo-binding subunit
MTHIGQPYPVHDAILKVTGRATYTTDMKITGMLYGKILFSPVAHAKIKHIDTSAAEQMEGVHAVCTFKKAPQTVFNSYQRFEGHAMLEDETIFSEEVRYVGDKIAAVSAETQEIADQAIRKIKVEYEELPAVFTIEDANQTDAPRVHTHTVNRLKDTVLETGSIQDGFKNADHIFEDSFTTPAIYHAAMENHCSIADYKPDNHVTVWTTTQNIFATRMLLGKIFDLTRNKIRVKKPILGGAFGGKVSMSVEPVAVLLSKISGRPVKVELNRREDMNGTNTRHASAMKIKTGIKSDGTITAQEVEFLVNTGAYITGGSSIASAICHQLCQLYKNINLKLTAAPVYTNITPAGAMRGYGAPQLMFGHQVHLNKIARKLGLDFTQLQLQNLVEPNSINPLYNNPQGNVRAIDCVVEGIKQFDWDRKLSGSSTGPVKRGVGMAVSSIWNGVYGVHIDATGIRITLNEDGTFMLHTATHDMGQGTSIALAQVVAEELGVDPDDIRIIESDTDSCLWDLGSFASRGIYVSCEAGRLAAVEMREKIVSLTAENYNVDAAQIQLVDKKIVLGNGNEIVSLAKFSSDMLFNNSLHLEVNFTYDSQAERTSYAAHFAEVEVDSTLGTVKVIDYLAVHDVGKVINQLGIEGQVEGGVQMGLGFALSEEIKRNEKGGIENQNFRKYKMFRALEMPEIKSLFIEKLDFPGPYGAKCVSEIATVPVAPAVVNAVVDAIGKDFYSLPINPEQIKE